MKKLIIDGKDINCREDLFLSLKEQMQPQTFEGNNLDALYDALTENAQPVEIEIRDIGSLRRSLGDYTDRLLRLLMDYQAAYSRGQEENDGEQ